MWPALSLLGQPWFKGLSLISCSSENKPCQILATSKALSYLIPPPVLERGELWVRCGVMNFFKFIHSNSCHPCRRASLRGKHQNPHQKFPESLWQQRQAGPIGTPGWLYLGQTGHGAGGRGEVRPFLLGMFFQCLGCLRMRSLLCKLGRGQTTFILIFQVA